MIRKMLGMAQVMLFGAHDSSSQDAIMQITVAFNHFGKRLIQRMPRCRWGLFHILNNDYTHWNMYAIGGSNHPTIISQGNRFIAPLNPRLKEVKGRSKIRENKIQFQSLIFVFIHEQIFLFIHKQTVSFHFLSIRTTNNIDSYIQRRDRDWARLT